MKQPDSGRPKRVSGRPGPRAVFLFLLGVVILVGFLACEGLDPFQFATFSLRDGRVGEAYADTIRTEGGRGEVAMRLVDGQLPPGVGLRVAGRDGILYGLPSRAGDFQFTVEARDSTSGETPRPPAVVTQGFAITIDSL
ncbi:MAG: hypothetical protein R6X12_08430 [bacterium]